MKSLQAKIEERTPEPENGWFACPKKKNLKRITIEVCEQCRKRKKCKAYKEAINDTDLND